MAKDNRSGLWGAQERARKAMVHANKVGERAKRALRVAAARERSAARHDRHAETLEAHAATRAAPPSGATPGWTARPRTLSASANAFDQGGVLGDEPANHPPRSLTFGLQADVPRAGPARRPTMLLWRPALEGSNAVRSAQTVLVGPA